VRVDIQRVRSGMSAAEMRLQPGGKEQGIRWWCVERQVITQSRSQPREQHPKQNPVSGAAASPGNPREGKVQVEMCRRGTVRASQQNGIGVEGPVCGRGSGNCGGECIQADRYNNGPNQQAGSGNGDKMRACEMRVGGV